MKQTINQSHFVGAFADMGRADNFSYAARVALFEYLSGIEEDTGEEIELDVIAICCEYSEHPSALDAAKEYGFEPDSEVDEEDNEQAALGWLLDRTTVIETGESIVIQGF